MDWPSNLVDFNHEVQKFYTFDHHAVKTIVGHNSNMVCTDLIVLDFLVDEASKEWRANSSFLVPNKPKSFTAKSFDYYYRSFQAYRWFSSSNLSENYTFPLLVSCRLIYEEKDLIDSEAGTRESESKCILISTALRELSTWRI